MKTPIALAAVILSLALMAPDVVGALQQAETHWDKYKDQRAEPVPDRHLTDPVLIGAIDLHVHPDPDVYPRQADAFDIAKMARARGLRGLVLKNHFTETAGLAQLVRTYATPGFDVFGGLTLDLPVGGINPQAVRYMVDVAGHRGRIVWMPTHDSEHEVRYNKESRPFVPVSRNGQLLPEVHEVIALVAQHDLALATGHVEPDEALQILRAAKAAGVKRLIVTHPMFAPQYTWMSIDQMRAAVDLGAYLEITGNSVVRDPEAKPRVLSAIRAIGARHFFVSTDSGLIGTPNEPDTLALVAKGFRDAGIAEADLSAMFKDNPAFLVGLLPAASVTARQSAAADALQERLDRLEAGVRAEEAIRAVKRLQHVYSHYLEAGLWDELADLCADNVVGQFPSGTLNGKAAVRRYFMDEAGRSAPGLAAGQLNTHLILQPIVTLGADGTTAKGTWHEMAMLGQFGASAMWKGGVYENDYALDRGVWKIVRVHYFPQYNGAYDDYGHKAPPRWEIPYHFVGAHVGLTIPESAWHLGPQEASRTTSTDRLALLSQRVQRLHDETAVQNLQHSYGYYLDRKLWDDVADLFDEGGSLNLARQGTYVGREHIRRALEAIYGGAPLRNGELFDHINLATVVTLAPDGRNAAVRTTQLAMLGQNGQYARWEEGTFENEFVLRDGVWRIKAVRYFPRMATDYDKGWARDAQPLPVANTVRPPDRAFEPLYDGYPKLQYVGFHFVNPVTGRAARYPSGPVTRVPEISASPGQLRGASRTMRGAASESHLADVEQRLDAAIAVDAVENLNSSYGYYIDESDWDQMADTFAVAAGAKEITGAGTYVGRERIRTVLNMRGPRGGRTPTFFTIHQLTQPVIHVATDGQSAKARLRLFQGGGNADGSSGSWIGGIYENTAVKENGEWKFGIQDLHHIFNASYRNGWARFGAAARGATTPVSTAASAATAGRTVPGGGIQQGLGGAVSPNRFTTEYPPDRPIRSRQYAFPEIDEPAFHYTNPVSGRVPARVLP